MGFPPMALDFQIEAESVKACLTWRPKSEFVPSGCFEGILGPDSHGATLVFDPSEILLLLSIELTPRASRLWKNMLLEPGKFVAMALSLG